jgi:hypothetical protein
MRTSGVFETLVNFVSVEPLTRMRRLELGSAGLSFICLLGSIGIIAQKYPLNISLTRNMEFFPRDPVQMDYMKLWHYAADMSCRDTKDFEVHLLKALWENTKTNKKFDGLAIELSVNVSEIELCFVAFFIYVFSTSFSYNGNPLVDVRTGARHADGRLSGLWIRHGLKKGTRVRAGRFTKYQNR